ncbi:hypothetical protein A6M27_03460 [Acidithiobacillus thiooxidans]|jgi:hypothetical protein|uniref:RiboL-PSP-HEPN domain-containing protein n=1 Tax=Acidithiobacillus thiooxidans TaxID=930 RepID=A0A1C2J9S5_ACITH|nr:hypothetical protein [Acidithiobacillus thiooxidans]OCX76120.1 hypothetical protein A6P07_03205 [Acidithiobacillus thiooxidans]OCX79088.1 hypothetical protein A6O24_02550 [Acidithiobacillus thiooxidans]OCX84974.1 hypothetical protein A6O26_02705 [Acidithiobacillus thiooxidans]OCX89161.1 hypothetical protein A6M27_03460 [Acidithiobacillus thiooxidans]OFC41576.1 hypothetical protein BAE47_17815 [Acidithiobacillus thiooxidans]
MKFDKIEEDLLSILHNVKPYVPILAGIQLLSSKLADTDILNSSKMLSFILQKKYSLVSSVAIAAIFLYWMHQSTIDDLKKEIARFTFTEKFRPEDNPFTIEFMDNTSEHFFDVDEMAECVGRLYVAKTADLATRSFVAARRTIVLGWVDPYALRTAEFLAIRSLEQLLHDRYPDPASVKKNQITGVSTSKKSFFRDSTINIYLNDKFGSCFNIEKTIDDLIEIRDSFAHRDDPSFECLPLRFAPFQLVSALLEYRDSKQ